MARVPSHFQAGLRRYALVGSTVLVGAVGGLLFVAGLGGVVPWLFAGYALGAAALELVVVIRQVIGRRFGVDVLAVLAILATVAVGEYLASMIIVLMLASGRALEDFAAGRAQRELNALLAREPQVAHRKVAGSDRIEDIPVVEVEIGDLIMVRSGEMVPVDSTMVSPASAFDLSSITGESMPVPVTMGDRVLSGSVNGTAVVTLAATARAENSQYQAIVGLVKQASQNRAPVVRLADRYALPFTIVALVVAAVGWLVSGTPVRAAEVLVLATPCPLLLAAPVAFIGGMSRAARAGVVVKGGAVLEVLARAKTVVFDKTGTLTAGVPTLTRVQPAQGFLADDLLLLTASAERYSSHVLAASIAREAEARGADLLAADNVVESEARGVEARVDGRSVVVGTLAFVRAHCAGSAASALYSGELAIYVAIDGRFAGSIIASDPVRANARATLRALRSGGVSSIVMLTGDAQATADHVATTLGLTEVRADCLPADKVAAVAAMRNRPVVMVGDGVNDAPVLAAADVGIAMGARGATAASQSAGAVILVDDISLVASAHRIGIDTVRIAMQSIWLGVGLSVALMIVATFGVIPAIVGAALQEVVDLATILNALRALRDPAPKAQINAR